jgi:thiamine-phosphate pyrophosphorylase
MASLTLLTPLLSEPEPFTAQLEKACATGIPEALILRFAPADERSLINAIKHLAPIAQAKGIAVLVEASPHIAIRGGADGVHITKGLESIKDTVKTMKPARMVGVGGLKGRDDAMIAGEMGVDYVMFGEAYKDGEFPKLEQVIERSAWWSELFEIPCIAFAPTLESILPLARTGAEFIGLCDAIWLHEEGIDQALTLAAQLLAQHNVPE